MTEDPGPSAPPYRPDQLLGAHHDHPDTTGELIGWEPALGMAPDVGAETGPSLSSVPGFDSPAAHVGGAVEHAEAALRTAAHPEIRQAVDDALNCSVDRCARCKVCDNQTRAVMLEVVGPLLETAHDEKTDLVRQRDLAMTEAAKLRAELEHAKSALAGDSEGIRLWMLDCGSLTAEHRARADAAELKLAAIAEYCRKHVQHVQLHCPDLGRPMYALVEADKITAIIDGEADPDA